MKTDDNSPCLVSPQPHVSRSEYPSQRMQARSGVSPILTAESAKQNESVTCFHQQIKKVNAGIDLQHRGGGYAPCSRAYADIPRPAHGPLRRRHHPVTEFDYAGADSDPFSPSMSTHSDSFPPSPSGLLHAPARTARRRRVRRGLFYPSRREELPRPQ
jgi:hypothetical protein